MNTQINIPEKLNLWDRIFHRYRTIVHQRGHEAWNKTYPSIYPWAGEIVPNSNFTRDWVEYRVIDRVTGSEIIQRKYLN